MFSSTLYNAAAPVSLDAAADVKRDSPDNSSTSMRILSVSCLAAILFSLSFAAAAVDDATRDWLVGIGKSQQSADRLVGGVRERGVWVARQGHCPRVGVLVGDPAKPVKISNYRICGTRIVDVPDSAPAESGSEYFRYAAGNAAKSALLAGDYIASVEGFEVRAIRLEDADAAGCARVETTVSHSLLLSSNRVSRVCP